VEGVSDLWLCHPGGAVWWRAECEAICRLGLRELCIKSVVVKNKPDFFLLIAAAFGIGVLVTMLLPLSASDSVASPASELQAGVIIE
jgi:hypothetical protein